MTKENILEKIKKILAKTNNNPSEHEVEFAMLKAQELLTKYNLTMQDLEVENEEKNILDDPVFEGSRIAWWKKQLLSIVAHNFKCECYINHGRYRHTRLMFFGIEQDVELAKEIFKYAAHAIENNAKRYVNINKRPGIKTTGLKNDYIQGFLQGLRDQFAEQVRSKGYALILVKDDAVVEKFKEKKLKKGQGSRIRLDGNQQAKEAGYIQGRNFQRETRIIETY